MLILYVALKYDYGKLEQGYSFEHYNFYDTSVHMGHDVLYFDFITLMRKHGRNWMNHRLLEAVKGEKPDLLFCILFKDELDRDTMRKILKNTEYLTRVVLISTCLMLRGSSQPLMLEQGTSPADGSLIL